MNASILTMTAEQVKRERFLLECKGLLENKAVHALDQAIEKIKGPKISKAYINLYVIQ